MTDAARDRRKLHEALREQLGARPADTLMAHLPDDPTPNYATRDDLLATATVLRGEMAELRAELRNDMTELRAELRNDMTELRAELRDDMSELRVELRDDMAKLRVDLSGEMEQRFREQGRVLLAQNVGVATLFITAMGVFQALG